MPQTTLELLPAVDPDVQALHNATACYTRSAVVEEVLSALEWPDSGTRLLDPGAGDGAFLEAAIARLPLLADDTDALAARVEGWEIHPEAAAMARARISAHLAGRGWSAAASREVASRVVREADFLAPGPTTRKYDVVAGNPPYLRFANLPPRLKDRYSESVPDYARADLLHAFLDRAADVMTDGARLGLVTADRWLFNEQAARLRSRIGERFGVHSVRRLEAGAAFYRAKTRRKGAPPRVHPVVVILRPSARARSELTAAPIYPGPEVSVPKGARELGSVARVRLAPWLGPHGVFTLDREDALDLPADALVPCVDTDDVVDDEVREPRRVAIRTERDEPPDPSIEEHLRRHWDMLPARASRPLAADNWWLPPEKWSHLPFEEDSLLIPRIARGVRAIRLPAGVLPINHNLSVVSNVPGGIDALVEALAAPHVAQWIERHAPRLESGYFSISTRLLRKLPVVL